jgi:CheY-like chemotaxis protein/anti-sigma regulatory factor (Ser/Thr protein kinase)
MREFYRPQSAQLVLAPVQLNRLLEQVLELTRARWHDMSQQLGIVITVKTELTPELPNVPGIESEIREALTNLIINAVDAMPSGGTLTLRTTAIERQVTLEVADTGIGMDEETSRKCLEPFFTTKGERGTGLGLAMVYGVTQRHGAQLQIDSAPGQGTRVRLVFAMAEQPPFQAQVHATVAVPPRLRILAIDDDPLVLKSLGDILQREGHHVATASDPRQGLETFRGAHSNEPFSVVLTDLGMPHMDGRAVAQAIKQICAATPVILLTGWGQRFETQAERPPHVDCVLGKPPKIGELRAALARCCSEARPQEPTRSTL